MILKFPRFFFDFHYGSAVPFRNKDVWRGFSFLSICSKISYKISCARDFHLKNEFYTICGFILIELRSSVVNQGFFCSLFCFRETFFKGACLLTTCHIWSTNSAVLKPRTGQFSRTRGQGLKNVSSRTPPLINTIVTTQLLKRHN